jgi:hypothetical protein
MFRQTKATGKTRQLLLYFSSIHKTTHAANNIGLTTHKGSTRHVTAAQTRRRRPAAAAARTHTCSKSRRDNTSYQKPVVKNSQTSIQCPTHALLVSSAPILALPTRRRISCSCSLRTCGDFAAEMNLYMQTMLQRVTTKKILKCFWSGRMQRRRSDGCCLWRPPHLQSER